MASFRQYLETATAEIDKDIVRTLSKLPASHRRLVHGYTFQLQGSNTLEDDDEHIGYIEDRPKKIVVAAPWNYGREFTLLHEVGHKVYDTLSPELKKKWARIVAATEDKQAQSPEELFSMAYANHYAKHKVVIHDHETWNRFIANLPK